MAFNHRSFEYLDALSVQIARMSMAAAYYEDELTIVMAAVLGLNALQANALVRPLNIRAKLDLVERLAAGAPEGARKPICKHARRVKKMFEHRNALIHGTFGHDDDDHVIVRSYMGKHKLTGRRDRWSAERVSGLADLLVRMKSDLEEVTLQLTSALLAQGMIEA